MKRGNLTAVLVGLAVMVTFAADASAALETGSDTLIAAYAYDGLNQRIVRIDKSGSDVTYDYYYNTAWQVLEVRKGEDTAPYEQYVWDQRYIDAPVLRWWDENTDGQGVVALYYCNDANMNVTALVGASSGNVVERYVYDAYGKPTFYDGSWALVENGGVDGIASAYGNNVLYCGYRYDPETGLFEVRNRMYHPTVGRFMQRDPAGYVDGKNFTSIDLRPNTAATRDSDDDKSQDGGSVQHAEGMNLYQYARGMAVSALDPEGLGTKSGIWVKGKFVVAGFGPRHVWLLGHGKLWDFGPDLKRMAKDYHGISNKMLCGASIDNPVGPPLPPLVTFYCHGQSPYDGGRYARENSNGLNKELEIDDEPTHGWWLWERPNNRRIEAGDYKNKPCWCVKVEQIMNCLDNVSKDWDTTEYKWIGRNCIDFAEEAKKKCCLVSP